MGNGGGGSSGRRGDGGKWGGEEGEQVTSQDGARVYRILRTWSRGVLGGRGSQGLPSTEQSRRRKDEGERGEKTHGARAR